MKNFDWGNLNIPRVFLLFRDLNKEGIIRNKENTAVIDDLNFSQRER